MGTHQLSEPISNAGENPVLKSALKGTVTLARFTKILAYILNTVLTEKLSLHSSISTCRECAPRRHEGRQLDHLGLLGLAAADGLVLEDEGVLDGLVEILAWEKQSQHFAQQLSSGFRCVGQLADLQFCCLLRNYRVTYQVCFTYVLGVPWLVARHCYGVLPKQNGGVSPTH